MVLKDSAYSAYFSEAKATTNPLAYQIYQEMMEGKSEAYYSTNHMAERALEDNDNVVLFQDITSVTSLKEYPCDLSSKSPKYYPNYIAFPFQVSYSPPW